MSGSYFTYPIAARCAVIGDSNSIAIAQQLVIAAQSPPYPRPAVALNFIATTSGFALNELQELQCRLEQHAVTDAEHDCAIVMLGVNEMLEEDANYAAYLAGTYPSVGGMPYLARVKRVVKALHGAHVYWIGVSSQQVDSRIGTGETAQLNAFLSSLDTAYGNTTSGFAKDPLFHFIHPDDSIAQTSGSFYDGIHYAATAAQALSEAVVLRILADFA